MFRGETVALTPGTIASIQQPAVPVPSKRPKIYQSTLRQYNFQGFQRHRYGLITANFLWRDLAFPMRQAALGFLRWDNLSAATTGCVLSFSKWVPVYEMGIHRLCCLNSLIALQSLSHSTPNIDPTSAARTTT